MLKDTEIAKYPNFSHEHEMDVFGKKVRVSTVHKGKLFRVEEIIPTYALARGCPPASTIVNDVERRLEDDLIAALER